MFHKYLKEKYEFITNYFEAAAQNQQKKLPHSIILYGADSLGQYISALNLAKILNCSNDKKFDCNCLNCRWILENKHPAVMTITKYNNKPADDDSKTVISVAQARMIKDAIANTSQNHRVFIFCDVENTKLTEQQEKNIKAFEQTGFSLPVEDGKIWYPMPLNSLSLPDTTANALLKSIEEPPEGVTFIFLTKDKNDLISTIVSRSQCFHIPDNFCEDFNDDFINSLLTNYPNGTTMQSMNIAADIIKYISENEIKASYIICCIQKYLQKLLVTNIDNKYLLDRIKRDIKHIAHAQHQISANVKEQNVLETLMLKIFNQ